MNEQTIPLFERFLAENQQIYSDLIPITPSIEDCFIELSTQG
jgi:hypothetical protein